MADKFEQKERFDGQKVNILMPEYVAGTDKDRYQWRKNISIVNIGDESLPVKRYLTTAERYFCSSDWFGSEKRKNPA
ncbi:MAG: hypothetical protein AB1733_12830 [Thermodesulfobacteriota bacterium]